MGIGSVLVQPQRIQRLTPASRDAALIEDSLRLAIRMVCDPDASLHIFNIMGESIQETALRFKDRTQDRLTVAYQRLEALFQPILDYFQSFDASAVEEDASQGMRLAEQMLEGLTDIIQSLTLDALRSHMDTLVDILENDLGLTGQFLEDETWAFVDGIIQRLETIPQDLDRDTRENRLEAAATLHRVKNRLMEEFEFPRLDAEHLARTVLSFLRQSGIEAVIQKAQCAADGMEDAVEVASSVNDLIQRLRFQSVGASGNNGNTSLDEYCWYATWLLQYKYRDIPLFELDDFKDARGFANKIKTPAADDAVSRFIRSQLTDAQRTDLDGFDGTSEPDEALKKMMLSVLNILIQEQSMDDIDDLSTSSLSSETREVGDDHTDDREHIRYNRMILEDTYTAELEKMPRSWGSRFWHALGEFILETSGWPGEQVRTSDDGKYLMLGDKIMYAGTNVSWQDAPIFNSPASPEGKHYYRFHHVSKEFMEGWAWHSTWANDTVRTLWHLLNIMQTTRGHFVPAMLNGVYDVSHGLTSAIARRPFSGFEFFSHKWLEWTLGAPLALTTAGSAQGAHTQASFANRVAFWVTVYLGDIINYVGPVSTTNALRDLTLSFMTALNFRGPQDGPSTISDHCADNYKELDGIVNVVVTGFTYWLASTVERDEYVHPFFPDDVPGAVWAKWLAGGTGMGLFAGFAGTLIAEITAWAEDWGLLGKTMLKSIPKVLVQFWPILYSLREGDTDDGKFNPTGGTAFRGYPSNDDAESPYLLPYASGRIITVGQANQGFFSHNPRANGIHRTNPATMQSYGYDFAHDQAEEVLACRPGTVVDFFEGTQNDTTGDWNFIMIRHDVDDDGNPIPPDPVHDLDVGGTLTRTFAVYGHGRQNGVTDAFAQWTAPVPTANIVGTQVKRGQPIMLAGDTGTSFHNHLHMHVLPGTAGAASTNENDTYAIPFVFRHEGVLKALHWYESTNTRVI